MASDVPEASAILDRLQLHPAENPIVASHCVVGRPGACDILLDWAFTLSGGIMCDLAFIKSSAGSTVQYNAAVRSGGSTRVPRWMFQGVQDDNREAANLMRRAFCLDFSSSRNS